MCLLIISVRGRERENKWFAPLRLRLSKTRHLSPRNNQCGQRELCIFALFPLALYLCIPYFYPLCHSICLFCENSLFFDNANTRSAQWAGKYDTELEKERTHTEWERESGWYSSKKSEIETRKERRNIWANQPCQFVRIHTRSTHTAQVTIGYMADSKQKTEH